MIALLLNPNNPAAQPKLQDVQEAARAKGVQLELLKAATESEIAATFAALVQRQAEAVLVGADPFFNTRREQIVGLAASHAVPAIYQVREFVAAGGLISYGASISGVYHQAGIYAGKIRPWAENPTPQSFCGGRPLRRQSPP